MTNHFTRSAAAITTSLLAVTFTACGSDSDSGADSTSDSGTEATAPTEPSDDGSDSGDTSEPGDVGADLPLVAVGETVTINAVGTFDATYLGLGDLGPVTTLQGDEIQCLAILGEVTLVAEGEVPGASLSPQRADALDANGAVIDVNANAECQQQSVLTDAGYADAFGIEWAEGVAHSIRFDVVAIPIGAMGQLDRIQITPSSAEFEFEATVTETL